MTKLFWLGLQFFGGEGASAGASGTGEGGGQPSGENASAAAEQKLRELGVPSDKAKKRASSIASKLPVAENNAPTSAVGNENNAPQEVSKETPAKLSFDDMLKQDAEYNEAFNQKMQKAITERLKSERGKSQKANDALSKMAPALEVMARKYGQDPKNIDFEALAKSIENDDAYYEEKAMEMGTSIETAKRVDQLERAEARRKEAEQINVQQQAMRNHFIKLESQGEALKQYFPNFDLRRELQNPVFARMVDPKVGLSVEDAYHAVHRKEIQAASMQLVAQKTQENISNAIQSGSRRPNESGTSSQAPSVTTFDYRTASIEQRNDLKRRIREAAARGEKLYPGQ